MLGPLFYDFKFIERLLGTTKEWLRHNHVVNDSVGRGANKSRLNDRGLSEHTVVSKPFCYVETHFMVL